MTRPRQNRFFFTSLPDPDDLSTCAREYDSEKFCGTKSPESLVVVLSSLCRFQEVFPSRLGIVMSDVRDMGLSIGHSLVAFILQRLGATKSWMNFFHTYMTGFTIQFGKEELSMRAKRGLLFAHSISHVLSELVLFCLDLAMAKAGAPLVRYHDDFAFYSRTDLSEQWAVCCRALKGLGLSPNLEKSGSLWLRNSQETQEHLEPKGPPGPVEWRELRLNASGTWEVKDGAVQRCLTPLDSSAPILRLVNDRNRQLAFLKSRLGPMCMALGTLHAKSVSCLHLYHLFTSVGCLNAPLSAGPAFCLGLQNLGGCRALSLRCRPEFCGACQPGTAAA